MTQLWLYVNQIENINAISNLTELTHLSVDRNPLSDISPISNLTKLIKLLLYDTKISDIASLVANTGISGEIDLQGNLLSQASLNNHIPALIARGIAVEYDSPAWSIPFRLQSMNDEVNVLNLALGMSELATDGYDEGLDRLSPPESLPSPVQLHAYWLNPQSDLANRLSQVFYPLADSANFQLRVQAEEQPFTLSWDLSQVPISLSSLTLRQLEPTPDLAVEVNLRQQMAYTFLPLTADQGRYLFEIELSSNYQLRVAEGWNLISWPGQLSNTDPQSLIDSGQGAMSPLFRWNPAGYSYQPVTELEQGVGYWLLDLTPSGEVLQLSLTLDDSYTSELKAGWNIIGSVPGVYHFSDPQDQPDGSIANYSLFEWQAQGFSYQEASQIEEGKGYWVLCWNDCQLTVGGDSSPSASPQQLAQPEAIITLQLKAGQQGQRLEIGWDSHPTGMDRPLPPLSPGPGSLEAYLVGKKYRWSRQIQLTSESRKEWQLQLKSAQTTVLKVESAQGLEGQELVIRDGEEELLLSVGTEIQLPAGERQLSVALQSIKPEVTALLQNYPNPFNPETWIPYQLNQASEVSLSVYSSEGQLVREIDLGLKPAGNYQTTERAIYWDGRNANGESVSSGVYFYRLQARLRSQAGDYSQTRKMVILK